MDHAHQTDERPSLAVLHSGHPLAVRFLIAILAVIALGSIGAAARGDTGANTGDVQTAWRLLDYVGVDYGGAVANGRIKSASEYAEMNEFAASVSARLNALPASAARGSLIAGAAELERVIAAKGSPEDVATLAHGLAANLLKAYPVPLAPANAPSLARGATLFSQNCASCHGLSGDGRGPDAAKLTTPPIAFSDVERARQRSAFALYQVISQGIDGTAMQSFSGLSGEDRWALAFYAGRFAFSDTAAKEGERLWKSDPALRHQIPDLTTLAGLTPATLTKAIGTSRADAAMAYLRRHPEAVIQNTSGSLAVTRAKLGEALSAYRRGDRRDAQALALSAYLDGFEPVEPILIARDATLMAHIETDMGELRAALQRGEPIDDVSTRIQVLDSLFADAQIALAPDAASSATTFVGALTILLREGLEALLIVVAMIAFLRKAERRDILPYVHGGWVGALVAGAATWAVATYAIGISGASRELTEGFGSLFAAIVLLSVGIWMHGKAQANEWQRYIHERMSKAVSGRSAWLLFGLAFVVVYREVFETILFYAALWTQGNGGMMLAGAATAILLLAAVAWFMLRYSRSLPMGKFFSYSSWLMAALTVVLAGKGVSALQEAGIIDIAPLTGGPRVAVLGLFPTFQTLAAQVAMLAAIAFGFWRNGRKATRQSPVLPPS
jgi:high-affinity iron transporter